MKWTLLILISITSVFEAYLLGFELGMAEGIKLQNIKDSQALKAFTIDANKKLDTCHRVLGKNFGTH